MALCSPGMVSCLLGRGICKLPLAAMLDYNTIVSLNFMKALGPKIPCPARTEI